jgi:protein phosphatase
MTESTETAIQQPDLDSDSSSASTGESGEMKLECVGMTDVGNARDHNEDDFYLSHDDEALCIVADGMGGHRSGEVASAMAIKTIVEYYRETMPEEGLNGQELGTAEADEGEVDLNRRRLVQAIQAANSAVFEAASSNEVYKGMGTTIVSGYFTHRGVYLAHIGDSRAYRFRDGALEQRTDDHSLANEYVEMGILSADDVEFFPYKNVITRACGLSEEVEVAAHFEDVQDGDIYLFCSDGLTDMVATDKIGDRLSEADDLEAVCRELIERANENGGEDNVTVVIARAYEDDQE